MNIRTLEDLNWSSYLAVRLKFEQMLNGRVVVVVVESRETRDFRT